jgi:ubiquinone/menaquinone biosynthesis C-methylase UbiE
MERQNQTHVQVVYMNAENLGFRTDSFDVALCGFMGWYDCFDFDKLEFTHQDKKAPEIWRVLKPGARFVCCSWDVQEDVTWMEDAILRYHPAILEDREYIQHRPIGMSYEKAQGYELIFRSAGFKEIEILTHSMTFVSTDEEEWWRQMNHLGWDTLLAKIEDHRLRRLKELIFNDLQAFKKNDGICFQKSAFFVCARK